MRLGLESVRKLLAAFDRPDEKFPVVLIAGTNGKGSTAALLASMGAAAGYRTGLYTSPHLQEVRERIRIDGRAISDARLESALFEIVGVAERELDILPTYFEAVTALAFKVFAEEKVDLAIMEVGLGGRLDATNLANPLLSLITEIGLEHEKFLGSDLGSIAREKAGILRPGKPAFVWTRRSQVWDSIRQVARDLGANLTRAQDTVEVEWVSDTPGRGQKLRVSTPNGEISLTTGLLGRHQLANIGLAVLGAEELQSRGFSRLDRQAIAKGAARCRWLGRLETIRIPGQRPILLDAAHNPDGAESLAHYLRDIGESYDLLFGSLADKDVESYLPMLATRAENVVLTQPANCKVLHPSVMRLSIADLASVRIEEDSATALRLALNDRRLLLVVCGSIYLVGEIRSQLWEEFGEPPSAGSTALFGLAGDEPFASSDQRFG